VSAPTSPTDGSGTVTTPSTRTSVRDALLVALAGLVANGLNLVVTIVLARVLPTRDHNAAYGAFLQMVGLYIFVSLPGSAIAIAVVRRSSWWLARGGNAELEAWRRRASGQVVRALGVFAVVAAAASPFVARALGGRSWVAVLLTSLAAGCWVALAVERAFLQSCRRYDPLAGNFLLEGLARTVAVLAGAVALGVTGAVAGILLAEVVTWGHAWWAAARAVPDVGRSAPGTPPHRELSTDLATAICAFAMLALLQYVDVFLVGRLNAPGSGRYAAIAVVAKTLVYVAIVLSYYLLPETSIGARAGGHARRQLGVVLVLYAIPCAALLGVAAVAPHQLLALIYPPRLLGAAGSLAVLVAAMALLGLSFLLATYLLARGVRLAAGWLVVGTAAAFVIVATAHGAVHLTAVRDLVAQLVVVAGLLAMTAAALAHRQGGDG
jgi:O-antigen/teichoic acid export membrane protein